jgi:hypothetical protein
VLKRSKIQIFCSTLKIKRKYKKEMRLIDVIAVVIIMYSYKRRAVFKTVQNRPLLCKCYVAKIGSWDCPQDTMRDLILGSTGYITTLVITRCEID